MSFIAWLDTSLEQQRRAKEIINLFSDKGTIDDLGIGQIRDALSDNMFPGTSTAHTRARYLLFVPWTFQMAAASKGRRSLVARADDLERTMLVHLKQEHGVLPGMIGGLVGKNVKILPSQIYWTALRTYGVLTQPVSRQQISATESRIPEADELTERAPGPWISTLPPRPPNFPHYVPDAFDLSEEEASWLRERIALSVPDTVLGTMARAADISDFIEIATPWDALRGHVPPDQQALLHHAELFSTAMNGAAWLYNILLAEAYQRGGWTPEYGETDPAAYLGAFADWAEEARLLGPRFAQWNLSEFWRTLGPAGLAIGVPTKVFVESWLGAVISGRAWNAPSDSELRDLIVARERAKKGPLAMLSNKERLKGWTGHSGTRQLNYRWFNVTTMFQDIQEGLDRAGT